MALNKTSSAARAALTLQKNGVDARALVGGYNKWVAEVGRVEKGKK